MWWRALGLNPSDDKETVKKAYVALIKTIDQDKDIEEFTKVHGAYRMAMKSFKKEEKHPKDGLIDFELKEHWYIIELAKIYHNPKRRLNTRDWKNLFACMSFIEEKHFLTQYVDFFNEHYALTDNIWQLVEKYYPLSNRKDFRWPELVKGHMSITDEEIKDMTFDKASNYVTYKIHTFFGIIDGDYDRASMFLQILLKEYHQVDLLRWHLLCVIELEKDDLIQEAYEVLLDKSPSSYMANYLYGGYLMGQNRYEEARERFESITDAEKDSRIKELILECQGQSLEKQQGQTLHKPWLELGHVTVKAQKLLLKGDYDKALHKTGTSGLKLWGKR